MAAAACVNCPALEIRRWKLGEPDWQLATATIHNIGGAAATDATGLLPAEYSVGFVVAKAEKIRSCGACKAYFTNVFKIPELWWEKWCERSNGYFGCRDTFSSTKSFDGMITWFRVLVKQCDIKEKDPDAEPGKDYLWYKYNIVTRWYQDKKQTIIVVFNPLQAVRRELPGLVLAHIKASPTDNPFWFFPPLLRDIVRLQDVAVITIRNFVRDVEEKHNPDAKPTPNYENLHNLARHAIHVSETLDLCVVTADKIMTQHDHFVAFRRQKGIMTDSDREIQQWLLFFEHMIRSLRARAAANKDRLTNEINLAYNRVAQYDSGISVKIGSAAREDSAAMKTIAFLTLVFLPATFVSSVFGSNLFAFEEKTKDFLMSKKIWIYFAFAGPFTIVAILGWLAWTALYPPEPIGEEGKHDRGWNLAVKKSKELYDKLRSRQPPPGAPPGP